MKKHYNDNRQGYIQRAQLATHQLYIEVRALKESKPCKDCKNKYPYYVMTFDHLDAKSKVGDVARLIKNNNRKALFEEIAKCDLVCFNCHAQRTHDRMAEASRLVP